MSDREAYRQRWDDRYAQSQQVWTGRVNETIVEVASPLAPGTALDLGCGEGADALWLAERGWNVTGLDLSQVAVDRAAAEARRRGIADRCTWVAGDVLLWTPPTSGFDLVASHFVHESPEDREAYWRAAAAMLAPGGRLLIVGHHPSDVEHGGQGPRDPAVLFTPDEVASVLEEVRGLSVERAEARPRIAADGSESRSRVDTVVVARRAIAG